MNDEELGKLSYEELCAAERQAMQDEDAEAFEALRGELNERGWARSEGKPGVSPLLSRRVVRELKSYYDAARQRSRSHDEIGNAHGAQYEEGFADGLDVAARWLLCLQPDASSPLGDES